MLCPECGTQLMIDSSGYEALEQGAQLRQRLRCRNPACRLGKKGETAAERCLPLPEEALEGAEYCCGRLLYLLLPGGRVLPGPGVELKGDPPAAICPVCGTGRALPR